MQRIGLVGAAARIVARQASYFAMYCVAVSGFPAASDPIREFVPIIIVSTSQSLRLAIACATTLSAHAKAIIERHTAEFLRDLPDVSFARAGDAVAVRDRVAVK